MPANRAAGFANVGLPTAENPGPVRPEAARQPWQGHVSKARRRAGDSADSSPPASAVSGKLCPGQTSLIAAPGALTGNRPWSKWPVRHEWATSPARRPDPLDDEVQHVREILTLRPPVYSRWPKRSTPGRRFGQCRDRYRWCGTRPKGARLHNRGTPAHPLPHRHGLAHPAGQATVVLGRRNHHRRRPPGLSAARPGLPVLLSRQAGTAGPRLPSDGARPVR